MKYDLVYLVAESNWSEELKYSLRSFEKNFSELGKVWIVGYLPPYIDSTKVNHIPEPDMIKQGVYVESIAKRIINNLDNLSEDYIFSSDDNYILKNVSFNDFDPLLVQDLSLLTSRGKNSWQLMLWRTYDLLIHMGYSGFNYESHTPIKVNKRNYSDIASLFSNIEKSAFHRYQSICTITAYWNIFSFDKSKLRSANNYRVGFTNKNKSTEIICSQIEGKTFFFHDDVGLNSALKDVIHDLYPNKSMYEL